MFSQAVPVYYASLGVYSYLAIKSNFKQEKFQWIEKWVHAVAVITPLALCSVVTANESFNPRGTGCFIASSPYLCEKDASNEECKRGGTLSDLFIGIFAFGNVILYLIVPLIAMLLIGLWIKRTIKEAENSVGMRQLLVSARKQMMQDVMKQIGLYLICFWLTYICPLANGVHEVIIGAPNVTLLIIGNCILSLQGAILTTVYFSLQRITSSSKRLAKLAPGIANEKKRREDQLTVSKIRTTAETREEIIIEESINEESENDHCAFFIFDGAPSDDSPWAKYLLDNDEDEEK